MLSWNVLNFINKSNCLRASKFFQLKHVRFVQNSSKINGQVRYEHDFSEEQHQFILQTLNEGSIEQLLKYRIPKNCIDKLSKWRRKHGRFVTLCDVLNIQGFGVKTLDRVCKCIVSSDSPHVMKKSPKTRGNILTPALSPTQSKELRSALGLHFYATGISWAKIEREDNKLSDWNLFEYDLGTKKLSPADALQLVINVCGEVPASDVYVLEAPVSVTPMAQQSSVSVAAHVQRVQLRSMLVALLTTGRKHNAALAQQLEGGARLADLPPKVFFLRPRLPARLFRTLVGTEQTSAAATVTAVLQGDGPRPLGVPADLRLRYSGCAPVHREVLGQALLLTVAFLDVCVLQTPLSLKLIHSNNP